MVDLYAILGVGREADEREIKRAYRRLAVRYHPDSGGDQANAEMFIKVNKAYEVLSHPRRRWWYDHQYLKGYHARPRASYGGAARRPAGQGRPRYARRKPPTPKKSTPLYLRVDFQLAAGSLVLIIGLVLFYNNIRLAAIKRHDAHTTGKVYSAVATGKRGKNLHYTYTVGDSLYRRHEARPTSPGSNRIFNDQGIPVRRNYQFKVWYNPEYPHRGIIDLEKLTPETVFKVKRDAFEKLQKQEDLSIYQATCMVYDLYDQIGMEVLGIILSSEVKWYQSLKYNRHRYSRMKRSKVYKAIAEDCSSLIIIP